jgi:DNA-binding GntR family transcriptional regulator
MEISQALLVPGSRVPLSALTKAEAAYVEVRAQLLEGTLAPGSTINQENLAAALGLSVTPLREALRRLEGEGLVELRPHRVVSVLPLTRRELGELCVARMRLEPLAASLAAEIATPRELKAISALARQSHAGDIHAQLRGHREFHQAVYLASHNKVLADLLAQLWTRTDRYRAIVLRDRDLRKTSRAGHGRIAAALAARDVRAAADLTERHVGETLQLAEDLARLDPSPDAEGASTAVSRR